MTRQTNTEIINEIRVIIGLNSDGTRNGNGLLGDVKKLKEDMSGLKENVLNLNNKIEKHTEKIESIAFDIKEIKESLNEKIGMSNISNLHKILICVGALGGVISFIISVSSKLQL